MKQKLNIEIDVEIPMRDGVILRADIYRPADGGPYPAILLRTPYRKNRLTTQWGELSPIPWAKAGYAVVLQDTRGSGSSDGKYDFYFDQGDDGYDSCEWIASQEWCNGKVGGYGHSYYAYTQLTMAAKKPPHLVCTAPFMQSCKPKYSGGFLPNALHAEWLSKQAERYLERIEDEERREECRRVLKQHTKDMGKQYRFIPEIDMPVMQLTEYFPYMKEYRIKVEKYDSPSGPAVEGRPIDLRRVDTPMLLYAGLYDTSSKNGPFENFITLTHENQNEYVRNNTKLVAGPWKHTIRFEPNQGELGFGNAEGGLLDINDHIRRFFDYHLKGIDEKMSDSAPVLIYIMGKNIWRNEYEYPLARTKYTPFYLRSNGNANTLSGDGWLDTAAPDELEPEDHFTYDPEKPAPDRVPGGCAGGIQDWSSVEAARKDMLVYSTPVLEKGIEAIGMFKVELEISSDCPDTDFVCRLTDVYPNGKSLNITEGAVRVSYNNTYERKLLEPGEIRHVTVDMGNSSIYFKEGHRIRLEVTSSCFPMIDRNHNTGNRVGTDTEMKIACNRVYHNAIKASKLILPVIPECEEEEKNEL